MTTSNNNQSDMAQTNSVDPSFSDIPSFTDENDGFEYQRISGDTLVSLLKNLPKRFKQLQIIDCRTPAEYKGGHIKGAINCHTYTQNVEARYHKIYKGGTLYVFHCEFSALRGPKALIRFRAEHEKTLPKVPLACFVLDGGYQEFYEKHRQFCMGGYTPEWETM
ncbi:hypothetical protein TRFO_03755 [Tritrichomonas foetus]|uniref:protein-tyrosine-phosphatase n=1 Tax=Tritrichomonas foetus TaxID=1144522 RepID=A0A1J4KR21_9EUKA|nr:hypothetical protein TRFO_03755 [Tritrichomonas foetus]|eukprot:OHT12118.1 hypothetical protein TRFO_03755 [Tritrichomonas foetus]